MLKTVLVVTLGLLMWHQLYHRISAALEEENDNRIGNHVRIAQGLELGSSYAILHAEKPGTPAARLVPQKFRDRYADAQYTACYDNNSRYSLPPLLLGRARERQRMPISIAMTFHEGHDVQPARCNALVEAVSLIVPHYEVYVSILAYGATNRTKAIIGDFAAALDVLLVDGLFLHNKQPDWNDLEADPASLSSVLYNSAVEPLLPFMGDGVLIFVEEIVTCAGDIIELVYQQVLQQADAVFGATWDIVTVDQSEHAPVVGHGLQNPSQQSIKIVKQPRMHDIQATRGINGDSPYDFSASQGPRRHFPITPSSDWILDMWRMQPPNIHQKWLHGHAFPAYSGWGGLVAFNASLFTRLGVRFRDTMSRELENSKQLRGSWAALVTNSSYTRDDCPGASERESIFRDIWSLRENRARVLFAPQTRATHNVRDWDVMAAQIPPIRRETSDPHVDMRGFVSRSSDFELIDWTTVSIPSFVMCMPTRTPEGALIALWGPGSRRFHKNTRPRQASRVG